MSGGGSSVCFGFLSYTLNLNILIFNTDKSVHIRTNDIFRKKCFHSLTVLKASF